MMRLYLFLYSAMIYCLIMTQTDTIFMPDGIEKLQKDLRYEQLFFLLCKYSAMLGCFYIYQDTMDKSKTLNSTKATISEIFKSSDEALLTKQEEEYILSQLEATNIITINDKQYRLVSNNKLIMFLKKGKSNLQSKQQQILKHYAIEENRKIEIRQLHDEAARSSDEKKQLLEKIEEQQRHKKGCDISMLIKEAHESEMKLCREQLIKMTNIIRQLQIEPRNKNKYELGRGSHRSNDSQSLSKQSYYIEIRPEGSNSWSESEGNKSYMDSQNMGGSSSGFRHENRNNNWSWSCDNESEHQHDYYQAEENYLWRKCKYLSDRLDQYQKHSTNMGFKLRMLQKTCEQFKLRVQ